MLCNGIWKQKRSHSNEWLLFCCSSGYGVIYKYVLIFSFIYEWQSVGGYGIPAIPTLL